MGNSNDKKAQQLGMPSGTAAGRLRKLLLFDLLSRTGQNLCFRCGKAIDSGDDLSIEHKEPWLDSANPVAMFFDLSNIAYSHLACNIRAGRRANQKWFTDADKRAGRTAYTTAWKRENYSPEERRERYLREGR